jgi:periplasmic nitrate reductase NapE
MAVLELPKSNKDRPMSRTPAPLAAERNAERRAVVFLTVVLAPIIAVLVVAGYGFCVWIYQLLAGPPGA